MHFSLSSADDVASATHPFSFPSFPQVNYVRSGQNTSADDAGIQLPKREDMRQQNPTRTRSQLSPEPLTRPRSFLVRRSLQGILLSLVLRSFPTQWFQSRRRLEWTREVPQLQRQRWRWAYRMNGEWRGFRDLEELLPIAFVHCGNKLASFSEVREVEMLRHFESLRKGEITTLDCIIEGAMDWIVALTARIGSGKSCWVRKATREMAMNTPKSPKIFRTWTYSYFEHIHSFFGDCVLPSKLHRKSKFRHTQRSVSLHPF